MKCNYCNEETPQSVIGKEGKVFCDATCRDKYESDQETARYKVQLLAQVADEELATEQP